MHFQNIIVINLYNTLSTLIRHPIARWKGRNMQSKILSHKMLITERDKEKTKE